jgi:hypothetical protein
MEPTAQLVALTQDEHQKIASAIMKPDPLNRLDTWQLCLKKESK